MTRSAIAIYGPSSQGKSETVREVMNQIMAAFSDQTLQAIDKSPDITHTIEIDGVKIGIESQGDHNCRMFRSLQKFVAQACDIVICSCRSRGATADAVEDLRRHHQYRINWSTNHRLWNKNQTDSTI